MKNDQKKCQAELDKNGLIPRKYYGQVFTTDPLVIKKFIQTVKYVYQENSKVVEVGGGLGYLTEDLANSFDDVEVIEYDAELFNVLNTKFAQNPNIRLNDTPRPKGRGIRRLGYRIK
ncbi:hypothetical protein KJ657_01240 [Patescibacteria group bacterium]|nr:hypothetical protein [Patescibacteria group bacterium]MBU1015692.1 hypothetical protein [Patescibacteria group bacterium]MBU1685370.1 hypothetical protein [Patescibacteria group bacterium]MBU1938404.1 hypothetical protein [Patescibacteria group bacterium]